MKKSDVVTMILQDKKRETVREKGLAFAPTNIALCKYWGKRDMELNLPNTSSLSISLPDKGALTTITPHKNSIDTYILNDEEVAHDSTFFRRTSQFLDLFRPNDKWHAEINIKMNIPVAAGLASSACGFASLASAMNDLFNWNLEMRQLSILSRLGSGSAARSLWNGFVEWHAGTAHDGMDCYAEPLSYVWPELRVGIMTISTQQKAISSRDAMQRTVNSSLLYSVWPKKVTHDLMMIKQALKTKNFSLLGGTSESNALTMHATMLSSWPPVCYFLPETVTTMQKVWELRRGGLELYFTEDAGPNLKLLFLEKDEQAVKDHFPQVEVVKLFEE